MDNKPATHEKALNKRFLAEVRGLIEDCGYSNAYEYCKCKYNNCVYNGKTKETEKYKNQIDLFRAIGMKEYRIQYENGTPSTHYSLISHNPGDIVISPSGIVMKIIERIV